MNKKYKKTIPHNIIKDYDAICNGLLIMIVYLKKYAFACISSKVFSFKYHMKYFDRYFCYHLKYLLNNKIDVSSFELLFIKHFETNTKMMRYLCGTETLLLIFSVLIEFLLINRINVTQMSMITRFN